MTYALRALALTLGVALIGATPAAAMSQNESQTGKVVRVVDGDTVIIKLGWFSQERVRLLNIDAPESVKPNTPVQCLGTEASDALKSLLPVGTKVRVETDVVARDKYKRQLAGVYVGSTLVNAEVVKRGFALPVDGGKNKKFLPAVQKAFEEAQARGVGFFEPGAECGVPAEAMAAAKTAESISDPGSATEEELQSIAGETAALGVILTSLATKNDQKSDHVRKANAAMVLALQKRVAGIDTKVTARRTTLAQQKAAVEAAAVAEAQRQAEAAAAAAEAQRQADEAAAQAAAQAAAAAEAARKQAAKPQPLVGGGGAKPAPAAPTPAAPPASGGGGAVYYKNCAAARAAGAAPVRIGQPGYGKHLDRDGDGIGCE